MKIAKVIPIYKYKERNLLKNYRPISHLPALSKLLERVVHKRVLNFLTLTNKLQPNQFGLRKYHSTIDAVTKFVQDTYAAIENNEYTTRLS